jgi:hypothetical protein
MPGLSAQQILLRLERNRPSYDQAKYDVERRKEREREATLRKLTQLHAKRWGLSDTVARRHVDQVSITSRRAVRDELGLD